MQPRPNYRLLDFLCHSLITRFSTPHTGVLCAAARFGLICVSKRKKFAAVRPLFSMAHAFGGREWCACTMTLPMNGGAGIGASSRRYEGADHAAADAFVF